MKNLMKRALVVLLALMLALPVMLPAMAEVTPMAIGFSVGEYELRVGQIAEVNPLMIVDPGMTTDAAAYKWTSSNKKVVSVSGEGVITAKKTGSAKITATSRSDKNVKATIKIKVTKNKVDNLNEKPAVSSIPYGYINLVLKSVEITAPGKVAVEYYLVWNAARSNRAIQLNYVQDYIGILDPYTGAGTPIVDGKVKKIKVSMKGGSVKKVKVNFSGSKVGNTNISLPDSLANLYQDREKLDAVIKYRY